MEIKTICANPDSIFRYFGWPTVTRLPSGALAMAASGFRLKHICPFGKCVMCYSYDEGKTWTKPAVIIDTPLDDRDCGLCVFDKNRVMLTSFNNTLDFQKEVNERVASEHTPKSEQEKELIDAYISYARLSRPEEKYLGSVYTISDDGGYTFGTVKKSPVTSPHGPCVLKDGTVLYVGRRFSCDDSFDDGKKPFIECYRLDKNDDLEYVSSIENVFDGYGPGMPCEPHAVQLKDGRLIVHIRVQRSGEHRLFTLYQSESFDNGHTFTRPHKLLSDLGGSPAHLIELPDGTLLSVYGYREKPYGIRYMMSHDSGDTWETDKILYSEGISGDLGYPATVILNNGKLLTVWYESTGDASVIKQAIWSLEE